MTLCGAFGSNSVEFASLMPQTLRAYSMTAHCMPRQIPKNGTFVSREADRLQLAFDAAPAETGSHEDRVRVGERLREADRFQLLGVHERDLHLHVVRDAAVVERLVQRLVAVAELDVLAHERDRDLFLGVLDAVHDRVPLREVAVVVGEREVVEEDLVEALTRERERHLVDRRDVARRDDGPLVHVAEERDLLLHLLGDRAVGAAEEDVGLDPDGEELLDGVLRRLRLQLVGGRDVRDEREVHVDGVAAAHVLAELADRLEEGQRLDVAHGAADLHEDDVVVARDAADAVLDLVGDVRDDLHGLPR